MPSRPESESHKRSALSYHTIAEVLDHQGVSCWSTRCGGVASPPGSRLRSWPGTGAKDLDTVKQRAETLVLGASSDTSSRRAVLPPAEWREHLMEYLGQARSNGQAGVSIGLRD